MAFIERTADEADAVVLAEAATRLDGSAMICKQYTVRALVFLTRTVVSVCCRIFLSSGGHHRNSLIHAHAWLKHNLTLCALCLAQNRHISSCNVICYASVEHCTFTRHEHSFLDTDTTYLTFLRSFCADLRQLERGSLAEPPSLTGYEPLTLAFVNFNDKLILKS